MMRSIRTIATLSHKTYQHLPIAARSLSTTVDTSHLAKNNSKILALNDLHNIAGAKPVRSRWGRGTGSGRGKMCGFGHQKSRSTPRGFEGGQTPLYKRLPKIGFHNYFKRDLQELNLDKIQQFIDMGKLKIDESRLTTMRDLLESGVISSVREGVKLLAGTKTMRTPVHFEVSFASTEAIKAIEAVGGTVTCVHFNRLALRALIKPYKFELFPIRARPQPKIMEYYLDKEKCGYLSPEIQIRNLNKFGYVTSETLCREEHGHYMNYKRNQLRTEREALYGSEENLAKLEAEKNDVKAYYKRFTRNTL